MKLITKLWMIVICNGEVLTIWPHYLSVLTSFNFCCPLYPKMIHFDKWWKYSDLLCLNHLEMKIYKWCGPFPVLISYKNPNRCAEVLKFKIWKWILSMEAFCCSLLHTANSNKNHKLPLFSKSIFKFLT